MEVAMENSSFLSRRFLALAAILLLIPFLLGAVKPDVARAQCEVDGPAAVPPNQSFTLCAPSGAGYTYQWHGPGAPTRSSRCITISGRSSGTLQYVLVIRANGVEVDRCSHTVTVSSETGSSSACVISGPTTIVADASAELCGPESELDFHTYAWTGPRGFTASTRCVTVNEAGVYRLTRRNQLTGNTRQCSHRLEVRSSETVRCEISGPATIARGTTVSLCGPDLGNSTYSWRGPGGLTSTSACITARQAGTYYLTLRNRSTGVADQCSHRLTVGAVTPDDDDSETIVSDNCPRPLAFWQRHCGQGSVEPRELSTTAFNALARCIDERSRYFNWKNDVEGLCRTLHPAPPLTYRKQAARQFAALLANVCAGAQNVVTGQGTSVTLDPDTEIDFRGAKTVGELIALIDRMLIGGRGNFSGVNRYLNAVNNGRGIGPVCE
jgi:hypothetical protein